MALNFRLETFGGLAITDSVGVAVATQRRRLALLALVAAAGRRGISRDRVLAYLWPESTMANARHGLEQLLYELRRQLGAPLFVGVDPLRLNQEVLTSDVGEFEEALERGDVFTATSLYHGPFLDGFYLGEAEFESWAETERARLTHRYASGLEQLARQTSEAGDLVAAIGHWHKLVALDPLSSHATLALMTALATSGEAAEAIRHGRAYQALARAEGAQPSAEVSLLVSRLAAEKPKPRQTASGPPVSAVFHARESSTRVLSKVRPSTGAIAASLAAVAILLLVLAGARARRHPLVIIGTGNPALDVLAVQAAVDGGGEIILRGHFSFALLPATPVDALLASGWYPPKAEIRISRSVIILGTRDGRGDMATIESGVIPFYVDAPGERVTIRGLRFVRPRHVAILVRAVRGLEITSSKIEALVPLSNGGAGGISINTQGEMPLPSSPGNPENVSGHVLIAHNEIDGSGGTAQAPTAGVNVFAIGQSPDREVDVDIVGNTIANTTAPAINIRRVRGRVRVLGNSVRTSPETVGDVDAVRLVNGGSILMANNTVECKWPNAAAIQVYSPFAEWPTTQVRVEDNTVLMAPSADSALGDFSAGISVRGYARGNVVRHNRISGRARTALAMYAFRGGVPADNVFLDNRLETFKSTMADVVIGAGVAMGHVVGQGLPDRGTATNRER